MGGGKEGFFHRLGCRFWCRSVFFGVLLGSILVMIEERSLADRPVALVAELQGGKVGPHLRTRTRHGVWIEGARTICWSLAASFPFFAFFGTPSWFPFPCQAIRSQ